MPSRELNRLILRMFRDHTMSPTNHTTTITMWLNRSTHTAHIIIIKIKIKSKLKDEFISKEKKIIIKTETTKLLRFVNRRITMNTYKIPYANIYKKSHTIPVRVSIRMIPTTITSNRTPWQKPNEKSFTNITKRMINRFGTILFRIYQSIRLCAFYLLYAHFGVPCFLFCWFSMLQSKPKNKQFNEYFMYCNNFSWKFFITLFLCWESSHSNLSNFRNSKRILNLTSSALVFYPNWQISNFTFKQLRFFLFLFEIFSKRKKNWSFHRLTHEKHTHIRTPHP